MAKMQNTNPQIPTEKKHQKQPTFQERLDYYLYNKFKINFGPFSFKVAYNGFITIFKDHVSTQISFRFVYGKFLTIRFAE